MNIFDYLASFFLAKDLFRIVESEDGMFRAQEYCCATGWFDLTDESTMYEHVARKHIERVQEKRERQRKRKTIKRVIKV